MQTSWLSHPGCSRCLWAGRLCLCRPAPRPGNALTSAACWEVSAEAEKQFGLWTLLCVDLAILISYAWLIVGAERGRALKWDAAEGGCDNSLQGP